MNTANQILLPLREADVFAFRKPLTINGSQSFCSLKCTGATAATVCTMGSHTCNNQGYCKK